jgi:farnesyl-diphosphate farnesyltransferase
VLHAAARESHLRVLILLRSRRMAYSVASYSITKLHDLNRLLRKVSRSFYLSIRVLPRQVRPQVTLAYVLARATDTVADTQSAPADLRYAVLLRMRDEIAAAAAGDAVRPAEPVNLSSRLTETDRALLESFPGALALLRNSAQADRQRIGDVLNTITSGQEMDLSRFGRATSGHVAALDTEEELDLYTYRVAGCVGEFWTKMCRAHLFPKARVDEAVLLENGVRLGKGLQLVNILRDLPGDLRQGRCYIPRECLAESSLSPESLLDPGGMEAFRSLYNHLLLQTEACLAAGRVYVEELPRSQIRIRFGCTLPMLIGLETLARLRSGNVLDNRHRIKVSRSDVRRLIFASLGRCLRPKQLRP